MQMTRNHCLRPFARVSQYRPQFRIAELGIFVVPQGCGNDMDLWGHTLGIDIVADLCSFRIDRSLKQLERSA
jgi:hypothetical protein